MVGCLPASGQAAGTRRTGDNMSATRAIRRPVRGDAAWCQVHDQAELLHVQHGCTVTDA
jgi:hypothetical protein